jgi:hypothetical protein
MGGSKTKIAVVLCNDESAKIIADGHETISVEKDDDSFTAAIKVLEGLGYNILYGLEEIKNEKLD